MNILPKMQAGGGLPLATYLPGASQSEIGLAPVSQESKDAASQKDLINLIKEMKGLPSDTTSIVNSLQSVYTAQNLYSNGALDTKDLITTYLSALQKIKIAEFNEKQFDNAMTEVKQNGGLHEVAIDEDGSIFCVNRSGTAYKKMSLKDFYASNGKWIALTNSNLLRLRAEDDSMSFNNAVLPIVSNGIGEKKVTEMIHRALSKIGTTELSKEGYTARLLDLITKGLQIIADLSADLNIDPANLFGQNGLLSIDGLYKSGLIHKDLLVLLNQALQYLWNGMGQNARTWLAIKSGNLANPDKGAHDMLTKLMFASQDITSKFNLDYQKDLDANGGKRDDEEKMKEDAVQMWILGHGQKKDFFILNGTADGLHIKNVNLLGVTKNGQPMGVTTMDNIMESDFALVLDNTDASFGGRPIDFAQMSEIVVNSNNLYSMDLPLDRYALSLGIRKPDLNFLSNVEKAREICNEKKLTNPEEINAVYESLGLPMQYIQQNGEYKLNFNEWGRFGVMDAYATSKAFGQDLSLDPYVQEVTDENEIAGVVHSLNAKKSKEERTKYDTISGWDKAVPIFNGHDKIYKSIIFMPVNENYFNALAGSGTYPTISYAETVIEPRVQAHDRDKAARDRFKPQGSFN